MSHADCFSRPPEHMRRGLINKAYDKPFYIRKFTFTFTWLRLLFFLSILLNDSTHAPPYPLPTSFPHIFPSENNNFRARSTPLFTSLSTTPRTSKLFRAYAKFVEANMDLGNSVGLDRDETKELVNELWRIADGYDGEGSDDTEVDDVGEDEG